MSPGSSRGRVLAFVLPPYGLSVSSPSATVRALAWALVVVAAAITAGDVWAAAAVGDSWGPVQALLALARFAPLVVGLLIVFRRGRSVVGWAFVVAGGVMLLNELVGIVAVAAAETTGLDGTGLGVARVLANAPVLFFATAYAWPAVVVLIFPDGRPGRGARRTVQGIVMACVLVTVGAVFDSPVAGGPYEGEPNPLHVPALRFLVGTAFWAGWLLLLGSLVAGAAVTVRRLRASTGDRRLQWRWLLPGALLPPASLLACLVALAGVIPMTAVDAAVAAAQLTVVAAVFVAVTRHGLYGIDRLVNRAVVYAVLATVLVVVYAGVAAGAGLLLGAGSAWVTALATAAAAVAVLPVRARVIAVVDRRLAPRRVAAVASIRDLGRRIHLGTAQPADVVRTLADALGDPALRVRFPGEPQLTPSPPGRSVTPVGFAGADLAEVEHATALAAEPDLLGAALTEAAPLLAIARLQADLREHLREVEESRNRVVQAGIRERRRLERDLHDGVQQRLVALGILLRRVQYAPEQDHAALDAAVAQVAATIKDLRALAAGVRPPRLEDGLRAALEDLAAGSPVPLDIRVTEERLPVELETAAYFIACEAVTNAVKHASATRVVVQGSVADGLLRIAVTDDGRGGAVARRDGGGLAGMADRAGAYGGRLAVTSDPGLGTRVEVLLPCAS